MTKEQALQLVSNALDEACEKHPAFVKDLTIYAEKGFYKGFADSWKKLSSDSLQAALEGELSEAYEEIATGNIPFAITELSHVAAVAIRGIIALSNKGIGQ